MDFFGAAAMVVEGWRSVCRRERERERELLVLVVLQRRAAGRQRGVGGLGE
jgi:hypothetical protein